MSTQGLDIAYLFIAELDQIAIIDHNLISLALAAVEQLRQSKPLPGHLVPVVGIHELIIVHAVGGVSLDSLDCRLTRVQGDDVVDETLPSWREGDRLGWVGSVVFGLLRLTDLELLTGSLGGQAGKVDLSGAFVGGHSEWCGCERTGC